MKNKVNNTHYQGCCCGTSNPPCSYCTDTFECDLCGSINYSDEENFNETPFGFLCNYCIEQNKSVVKCKSPGLGIVYQRGEIVGRLVLKGLFTTDPFNIDVEICLNGVGLVKYIYRNK